MYDIALYCSVSIDLYSASNSAHEPENRLQLSAAVSPGSVVAIVLLRSILSCLHQTRIDRDYYKLLIIGDNCYLKRAETAVTLEELKAAVLGDNNSSTVSGELDN